MTTIKAHFDGKTIVPDEAVDLPVNQPLTVQIEFAAASADQKQEQLKALDALLEMSGEGPGTADWSRENIYSGKLDDPR